MRDLTAPGPPALDAVTEGDTNSSASRRRWYDGLDAETRDLLDADEHVYLRQSLSTPCLDVLEQAHGATLVDVEGREILDFHGNSVHQVGYGHPDVVAAVRAELDRLPFSPRRFTNRAAIRLAERLIEIAPPGIEKVLLAPSGALAIGMALKVSRCATGRHKTVSMWDSFHGASLDAISVGGEELFRRDIGPLLPGTEHVPPLHLAERFFGTDGHAYERLADYLDYVLQVQGDVAAVIAEPVRWTTLQVPPADFWPRVRRSCDAHGVLLVFDEIPSGLGRSGSMFVCEELGAAPDILVIGKGLGGGVMPLAATLVRGGLDVAAHGALGHYTHEKSPLGAAAALATLDVIESEGLVARARVVGAKGLEHLQQLARRSPLFATARGLGMYWGMQTAEYAGRSSADVADRLLYACLRRGLSFKIGGGDVITLCPPLNITDAELGRAFAILEDAAASLLE